MYELRRILDKDAVEFFEMMNDPTLSPNTGSVPYPITLEWTHERLERKHALENAGEGADRGLFKGDVLVGNAGWFLNEEGDVEIGYAVHKNYRGQGLATHAATLVLKLLKDSGYSGAVYAQYFQDNPASGRVLEKLGFQRVREIVSKSAGRTEEAVAWLMMLNTVEHK